MKIDKYSHLGLMNYEVETWLSKFEGAEPIKKYDEEDRSESYDVDLAFILQLHNGKYALIIEEGCSCYEAADAKIELFPTLKRAQEQFNLWKINAS